MNNANFNFVDAVYRTEANPHLAGNPFIEALPALPSDRELFKALTRIPDITQAQREASVSYRVQELSKLRQTIVALPRVVRLARAMSKMLIEGYRPRKPFSIADRQTIQSMYQAQQTGTFQPVGDTHLAAQHSMSLIGASGSGKSFCLRHIAGLNPPAIFHNDIGKWQLPFVFIEMAYDGDSVHTLATELFTEYDRLLPDGRFSEHFSNANKVNAQRRLTKALSIAHELGVGMIIVDEAQNQRSIGNITSGSRRKSRTEDQKIGESPLQKLLIAASNTSHIPMLFSGTLEMLGNSSSRMTRARRMSGRGSAVWLPLSKELEPGATITEFDILMGVFFRCQWLKNPAQYGPVWSDLFYDLTQGVPDIMVKLFEAAQEMALVAGAETLLPFHVTQAFEKEFSAAKLGLTALRNEDQVLLEMVTDLFHPGVSSMRERLAGAEEQSPLGRESTASQEQVKKEASSRTKVAIPSPEPMRLSEAAVTKADLRNGVGRSEAQGASVLSHPALNSGGA